MFAFPPVFTQIVAHLPPGGPVYVVGGAIRDILLGRPIHDIDFAVPVGARRLARQVADALGGAFYMLDEARETARVVLGVEDGERMLLDFALLRGDSVEDDLRARDFSANALALEARQVERLIDPLNGAQDIQDRRLRACSAQSFHDDPVRVLRAIRLGIDLGFRFESQTYRWLLEATPHLARVSPERVRDELFRIFESRQPDTGMRLLEQTGALKVLMPELLPMQGYAQPAPHQWDVWQHTLALLRELVDIFPLLVDTFNEKASANLMNGLAVLKLGKFRQQLIEHFRQPLNINRSRRGLLVLAALFHDAGKPATASHDKDQRLRFFGHEAVSAELLTARARQLAFSQDEIQYLNAVVRNHMRIHHLAREGMVSRKAAYHYFRDTGAAGVDTCLLALGDTLATYGTSLAVDDWSAELDVCQSLLEIWWEQADDVIHPPRLLSGDDLRVQFQLSPGPLFGRILNALEEAQAGGEVLDREAALSFVQKWLDDTRGV